MGRKYNREIYLWSECRLFIGRLAECLNQLPWASLRWWTFSGAPASQSLPRSSSVESVCFQTQHKLPYPSAWILFPFSIADYSPHSLLQRQGREEKGNFEILSRDDNCNFNQLLNMKIIDIDEAVTESWCLQITKWTAGRKRNLKIEASFVQLKSCGRISFIENENWTGPEIFIIRTKDHK